MRPSAGFEDAHAPLAPGHHTPDVAEPLGGHIVTATAGAATMGPAATMGATRTDGGTPHRWGQPAQMGATRTDSGSAH